MAEQPLPARRVPLLASGLRPRIPQTARLQSIGKAMGLYSAEGACPQHEEDTTGQTERHGADGEQAEIEVSNIAADLILLQGISGQLKSQRVQSFIASLVAKAGLEDQQPRKQHKY